MLNNREVSSVVLKRLELYLKKRKVESGETGINQNFETGIECMVLMYV